MRNYKILASFTLILLMVCPVNQSPTDIETCTKKISKCPPTKRQWEERTRQYNCSLEDLDYTCIHTTKGGLVEACMNPHYVETYEGKCPTVIACDESIYPVLAIEKDYIECPDNVKGCPTKNGPRYTVHELYRYSACLVLNPSELLTPTSSTVSTHTTTGNTHIQHETSVTVSKDPNVTQNTTVVTSEDVPTLPFILMAALFVFGVIVTLVFLSVLLQLFKRHKAKREAHDSTDSEDAYLVLKEKLRMMHRRRTEKIRVLPLQKSGKLLTIEELFVPLKVRHDPRYNDMMGADGDKIIDSPNDLFYEKNLPISKIFITGKAAYGKTMYCLWLLHKWLNNDQSERRRDEWTGTLGRFDLAFLLELKDMDELNSSLIIDMICKDLTEDTVNVRDVLSSRKYRCLIILDGLNEWNPKFCGTMQINYSLPKDDGIANAVILYTMRPWRLYEIDEDVCQRKDVRVIEILGLDKNGSKTLVEKVLNHSIGLKKGDTKYEDIMAKSEDEHFRALNFMKIPLLVCVCVWLWYEGEQLTDNIAGFYAKLVDLMINRAESTSTRTSLWKIMDLKTYTILGSLAASPSREEFLERFKKRRMCQFMRIFSKVGKIAYDNICEGKNLVFQLKLLEKELDKTEKQFLLDVGLISVKEVSSITSRNVRVSFLTKSLQEFLAAIYIVVEEEEGVFGHLNCFDNVMKMSNVIYFMYDMSQTLGRKIYSHVASIQGISESRRLRLMHIMEFQHRLNDLIRNRKEILLDEIQIRKETIKTNVPMSI